MARVRIEKAGESIMQRYTIQAVIYPGDQFGYVAECVNLAVVTQGVTLDETVQNLREAIQLHLETSRKLGLRRTLRS